MKLRAKRLLAILLTLLMAASVLPMQCLTAQAFTVRKSDPSGKDSHYYSKANPFYAGGYTKECTWYAWGRAYEALGAKPALSTSAAHHWYQENARTKACSYGTAPKAGAIMVTVKDKSHGHVAFVEELYSNGTMLISEYNYNVRGGFSTAVIPQLSAGSRRGRAHKVLGYIYVAKAKPADTTAPTITDFAVTNKNITGFTLTAKASDKVGVTAVKFKVRTENQSDKEALWFDAVYSAKDSCWKCRIPAVSFDRYVGQYEATCCAYDKAGNQGTDDITVSVTEGKQKQAVSVSGATEQLAASQNELNNKNGVTAVRLPTRIAAQANGDFVPYDVARCCDDAQWERPASASAPDPETAPAFPTITQATAECPVGGIAAVNARPDSIPGVSALDDAFDFAQKSAENLLGFLAEIA